MKKLLQRISASVLGVISLASISVEPSAADGRVLETTYLHSEVIDHNREFHVTRDYEAVVAKQYGDGVEVAASVFINGMVYAEDSVRKLLSLMESAGANEQAIDAAGTFLNRSETVKRSSDFRLSITDDSGVEHRFSSAATSPNGLYILSYERK